MNNIIQTIRHTARAAAVLLLALCAAQTAWAWDGEGTQNSPYQISSTQDLETLRDNVNGGQNYNNVYFKQTANITLSGNWTPIGTTESTPFKGHYDGGNFTITGLNVSGNYQYAGLFGYITSDYDGAYPKATELKNINIVECTINVSSAGAGNGYAGGIAGYVKRFNMSNCKVSGTIDGYGCAGGLIGRADSYCTMSGCFADVTVSAHKTDPNQPAPAYCLITYYSTMMTASGNYYHNVAGISAGHNSTVNDSATPLYMVKGVPSGVTVAETNATLTYNDKHYFAAGATATLTVDDANQAFKTFSVSGATGSEAADKKSATVTLATSDASVSATLQTVSGTCGTSATWALTQDGSGNYTRLTISGSGAMENYGHINDNVWHTTAPWGYDLTSVTIGNDITTIGNYAFIGCQQLSSLTIGSGVTTIGTNALDHCDGLTEVTLPASVSSISAGGFKNCVGLTRVNIERTDDLISIGTDCFYGCPNGLVIVAPTPALALQYKDAANWTASADKFRLALRSYLFTATNEGGVAAYAITCEDDLRNLAAVINGNTDASTAITGSGKTFRQTADITLSDQTFAPIGAQGTYGKWFQGTYDGGGYTISGLTISTGDQYAGLFGRVISGTIKNVVLISPTVTSNYSHNSIFAQVGALVGHTYDGSRVENCLVISPTVSASNGKKYVGAIVGYLSVSSDKLINSLFYSTTDYGLYGDRHNLNTITNSGRARKVIIGEGVTIENPEATSLEYGFQYDIDGNGVAETYYREGVTLTLPNNAPTGYATDYRANGTAIGGNTYTVNKTDGDVTLTLGDGNVPITYTITYNLNGGTLSTDKNSYTIESSDITLDEPSRTGYTFLGWYDNEDLTGNPVTTIAHGSTGDVELWTKWGIPYIDADGNTLYRNSATVLTNETNVNGLSAGWYVVYGNVSYSSQFRCNNGDIHLILCDGAKMTVTNSNDAIRVANGSLTIYAQSTGSSMGQLVATSSTFDDIYAGNVTICGGRITATGKNCGIYGHYYVTIHGGQVSATGDEGIYSGTITLGLRNATDYITASSYKVGGNGTISVKTGQRLTDEDGNTYSGELTSEQKSAIAGKTLYPYIENLDLAANQAPDGNFWTTYYCGHTGYKIDDTENACAYTATYSAGQLTLHNLGKQIPKNTAVIIVADNGVVSMAAATDLDDFSGTNDLRGVDVDTPVANITSDLGEGTLYVLGMTTVNNEKHFGFHRYSGTDMAAHKAFVLVSGSQSARSLTMVFDDATGISDATRLNNKEEIKNNNWFTLDGRRLQSKPTAPGIYVNNGKKVVIK